MDIPKNYFNISLWKKIEEFKSEIFRSEEKVKEINLYLMTPLKEVQKGFNTHLTKAYFENKYSDSNFEDEN